MKKTLSILMLLLVTLAMLMADLNVYFIDVGQADFEIIECDGHYMVIDGGNAADGQKVYSVLQKYIPGGVIDCYIGTHAHEDHMGASASVLTAVKAKVIYCPNNDATQKFFKSFLEKARSQGVTPKCPNLGLAFRLGNATVRVLGPFHPADANANNTSIVIKVTYGNTSFLFTGDAESEEENELMGKWKDNLKSTVLKVGHHGADTSTTYRFLRTVDPEIAVISVGKGNSYGHPADNTLSRLRDADVKVYRTDMQGDIFMISDGRSIIVKTEKNPTVQTNPTEATKEVSYIGNKNSKVFHRPDCSYLPAGKNRVTFSTRSEAVDAGYTPCGSCKP